MDQFKRIASFVLALVLVVLMAPVQFITANAADQEVSISFADKQFRTVYTSEQQVWEQNGVTVTNDKAASNTAIADYAKPARFYANSKLTVAYPGMTEIVFVCNTATYATDFNSSIVAQEGVTTAVNAKHVTVTFATPVDSFVVEKLVKQVRMDAITISSGTAAEPTEPQETTAPQETEPAAPSVDVTVVDAPDVGTAYKFGMVQSNVENKLFFITGAMDGYYMATTEDAAAAADVYLEETEGGYGYYLCAMVDGAKQYINMVVSGTHVNGAYEAYASTVYEYDAEAGTVIATVEDAPYWFGTRNDKTYTTAGPCKTEYAGFYCKFYAASESGETPVEPTAPSTEPTMEPTTEPTTEPSVPSETTPSQPAAQVTISFADKADRTEHTKEVQVWKQNGITVTNNKAASKTDVGDYGNPARFYQNSMLTVEYPGMTAIAFNCDDYKDYVTPLVGSISGAAVSSNGTVVTVTLAAAADSFVIENLIAQVRMDSITVYTGEVEIPEATEPEATQPTEPEVVEIVDIATAVAGANNEKFAVKGVVTVVDSSNYYVQDATGAICVRLAEKTAEISLGDTIIGTGTKSVYNGMPQLQNATYEMSSGMELVAKETTVDALTAADICTYVTIKGLTVTEVNDNNGQYTTPNISTVDAAGNPIQIYKAVVAKDGDAWAIKVGDVIDVTAGVGCYKDTLQLRNTLSTEIVLAETGAEPDAPVDPSEPEATEPTAPSEPEETQPTAPSEEPTAPSEEPTEPANPAGPAIVEKPVAGTAYKFGMAQGNLENKVYYLVGGMNGYYMATTEDATAALDVYLEETDGGYYLYAMADGAKQYINMVVSGTHVNGAYEAEASTVYTYDAEAGTVVATVEDAPYWFGTRNDKTYTTAGPCKVEYEGFYCRFYTVSEGGETPSEPEATQPTEPETNEIVDIATALAGADGTKFTVKGVVTAIDSSNYYVQDTTGAICVRMASKPTDVALGDTIIGTGTKSVYNGMPQLQSATYELSSGMKLTAKETTVSALTIADICTYVTIKGLTVTEIYDNNGQYTNPNVTTVDAEGNTIQIYKATVAKEGDTWAIQVGDVIDVTAAVGYHVDKFQLRNTLATEIVLADNEPTVPPAEPGDPSDPVTLVDFNGDGVVTDADAVYLLRHTLFPNEFAISLDGDVNGDGETTDADAVYLLRYTLFPEEFPLKK